MQSDLHPGNQCRSCTLSSMMHHCHSITIARSRIRIIMMVIQEKVCLAPAPPARTKSYRAASPLPAKIALVRSASENLAVQKEEKVVKEELLWTDAMVQDMFDCLDQVLRSIIKITTINMMIMVFYWLSLSS